MSAISTVWDVANARGDWALVRGAAPGGAPLALTLQSGNDLETAVLLSLFTDRLANPDDEIPDGTSDRRGWWGDLAEASPIGSRLWLLDRAKLTQETAARARDYALEALQWLIDDGVVASVDVATQITFPAMLGLQVVLRRQDGTRLALNYSWAWTGVT
ncbi:MAG: phage GP46 family protein [Patescibacteria group bacterium]|nr:phage GP46 family protein [Patescibacteria group bacterium]